MPCQQSVQVLTEQALAGQPRITLSSVDPVAERVSTHAMCRVRLLIAGSLLLVFPHPLVAAGTLLTRSIVAAPSSSTQTGLPEGNLPASRYLELRAQTLARARLIAGPRLKNPNLTTGGLDRNTATTLAEQRADRLNRVGFSSASARATHLLSDHPATVLPSSTPTRAQQPRIPIQSELVPRKFACSLPAIHAVNGRTTAPVFTPAEPDSHYRITGCGFGSAPGIVRLQPSVSGSSSGAALQPIALQIESWTDDHVDAHINPGLTGIPDFPADLVIQLPSGRSLQLTRCQFLAARGEPQLLRSIPAAWVRLDATSLSTRVIHQVEFESPPVGDAEVPPDAVGSTSFIVRSDPQAFATGRDSYELSQLAPGWVVESVQLRVFNASCPGDSKLPVSNGSWETSWTPRGFVVAWADETCSSPIPPVFNFSLSSSQYATNVWVIGPAGTQPILNGISARQP